MDIKAGQGFKYSTGRLTRYGIVCAVGKTGDVTVAPVIDYDDHNRYTKLRSYDDADANEMRDKDNVRLDSCPAPFLDLGEYQTKRGENKSNSVAVASREMMQTIPRETFEKTCRIIDNGVRISERDMNRIKYHPMKKQLQNALTNESYMPKRSSETIKRARKLIDIDVSMPSHADMDYEMEIG